MRKLRSFKKTLIEDLKDPHYATAYLSIALEEYGNDRNTFAFLTALRDVVEAKGGITQLAQVTHLNQAKPL